MSHSKVTVPTKRGAAHNRGPVVRRLAWYWPMEAVNVVLMPGIMIVLSKAQLGLPALLAMFPMSVMLIAGTRYLRAKYRQLSAGRPIGDALGWLAAVQLPLLAATLVALATMVWVWIDPAIARGLAERWVVSVAAVLAALEYVNYYHWQLQHFDNANDWQRLISGRGFRKSQLRRDLERAGLRSRRSGPAATR